MVQKNTVVQIVQLYYDQVNDPVSYASQEQPLLRFRIHRNSTHIETWTQPPEDTFPLRPTMNPITGPTVETKFPFTLFNKELQDCHNPRRKTLRAVASALMSRLNFNVEAEAKDAIVDDIVSQTVETLVEMGMGFVLFTLVVTVEVHVSSLHRLEEDDEQVMRWIQELYEEEETSWDWNIGLVPASESAIEGLEKVMIMGEANWDENMRCTVCLDDIKGGTEVSRLGCLHVFHGECIETWLKRNHYCPVCRFELPIRQILDDFVN